MPKTVRVHLTLPAELANRVEAVAKTFRKRTTVVAAAAIEQYCEQEEAVLAKIREGLAELDAGLTTSHEEAVAFVAGLSSRRRRFK